MKVVLYTTSTDWARKRLEFEDVKEQKYSVDGWLTIIHQNGKSKIKTEYITEIHEKQS